MSEKKELNPSPKFPSGDYPELSPNPNQREGLVNKTGEQPNTQFVNPERKQEKRCLTVSEVIELIQKYAPKGDTLPEVTSADNEKVLEVIAGAWGKGGKKVNIMEAPSSTTLSNEQIEKIGGGVFINGNFEGYKNPVLFPYVTSGDVPYIRIGTLIGSKLNTTSTFIATYTININTNQISVDSNTTIEFALAYSDINIKAFRNVSIKGKVLPQYPANNEIGQFICRKGTLEYYIPVKQDSVTSGDVIALDSNLGKALLDHLEVEINGFRARYEYTSGNYVVYSSKTEVDSGLKLQVNMISYNITNGELSFNQMTFTPDA